MALTYQNVPISFAQGVDTKTDPKQVVPGKLLELENGVFYQTRSIKKRDGFEAVTKATFQAGDIGESSGLTTFNNQLVEYTASGGAAFSGETDKWSIIPGALRPIDFSTQSVTQSATSYRSCDSAYHAGTNFVCSAFYRTALFGFTEGLYYSVFDRYTGTQIITTELVTANNVIFFKTLTLGSFFYIIYLEAAGNEIRFKRIDTAAPTVLSAFVSVVTDTFSGNAPFDATVFNSKIYLAYYSSNSTRSVGHVTITGVTTSTPVYQVQRAVNCIAVFGDTANNLWVGVGDDVNGVKGWAYNAALSALVVPVTVLSADNTSIRMTGIFEVGSSPIKGRYFVEFQHPADNFYNNIVEYQLTASGLGTNYVLSPCLGLTGKAFQHDGSYYLFTGYRTTQQPTYFLLRLNPTSFGTVVGKVSPQLAGTLDALFGLTVGHLPEVMAYSATEYGLSYLQVNEAYNIKPASTIYTLPIWGVQQGSFDFDAVTTSAALGSNLHSFGGLLSMFDGATFVEHGFNIYPEVITFGADTAGGDVDSGSYNYVATYEWTDASGQVHRSAPSAPFNHVVAAGPKKVNLSISNLNITQKGNVRIGIYRTTASGTVYYLANYIAPSTGDFTSTSDSLSDDRMLVQGVLYTTGGVVENDAVPAPKVMATYKNRMIVVPAEAPTSFWYSKDVVPGTPVEFSALFVQNIDQRGGGITAITQMDDKLCLFKEASIFVMTGDGPADTGANNDFTPAQEIATDSGCIDPRSLVLTPDGVMYQSAKGIYLLGRNLQVTYIGADVEAYNNNVITSATMFSKRNQVIFTLESGVALVYDYAFNQWSVFTGIDAVDATVYEDKIAYAKSDGTVMLETPGIFLDDNAGYSLKLKTSWLSFAGLQGFQRVYSVLLLGEYKSSHTLRVECAHDFVDTIDQTIDIVATSTPPFQYGCDFKYQKAQSVQLTIQDVSPTGESLELSNMAFEVGVKQGSFRVGQERTNA